MDEELQPTGVPAPDDPTARHAENHRYVKCPACGNLAASEYDIFVGPTNDPAARHAAGIIVIACGSCNTDTERAGDPQPTEELEA